MNLYPDDPFVKVLHFLSKDYFGAVSHLMAETDLDRNYYTLLVICRNESGLTQKELSSMLEVDKVTMSRKIDHLVNLGYITREAHVDDRRTILLKATPKASPLAKAISDAYAHLNAQAFEGLSNREREAFMATAEILRNNMKQLPQTDVKVEYKPKTSRS